MRKAMVAGNWKMNGSLESARDLLDGVLRGMGEVGNADVVICPPYVFIPEAEQRLRGSAVAWGAQDLSTESAGAYTGEIAASMLRDFGCRYVIVGHSERRVYHGESDQTVAEKFAVAREAGLVPILCLGETLEDYEAGLTEAAVARQLDAAVERVGVEALADGILAYEPVWAIGTGKTASPEQAQEVHAFIRERVAGLNKTVAEGLRILYGGSMKPENARELIGKPDIDGGLIGGASLKAEDFLGICLAAE